MPTIQQLLSRKARVIHSTRRSYILKRIVEFTGQRHVLYRFQNRDSADRFAETLAAASANGALLQNPVAGPPGWIGTLIHGHWLALSFADGDPIRAKSDDPVFKSLGESLAGLHHVSSPQRESLLYMPKLLTPRAELGTAGTAWLAESRARLEAIRDFRLTHGDLFAGNIIVTPDGSVVLIDYELFAFDLAGVELAMVLLRDYCRRGSAAASLLDGYLSRCDDATRQLWREYWRDFLVAGAFRLAAHRERRGRTLARRNRRWAKWLPLPLPASRRIRNAMAANEDEMAQCTRDAARHLEIAARLVEEIVSGSANDPVTLIARCHRKAPGVQSSRA